MAIFISAGHTIMKGSTYDPGASSKYGIEAQETVILRDLICRQLDLLGAKYITDKDNESLIQYLNRIKPGNASVVCDIHFNSFNSKASGTEVLIEDEADRLDMAMAKELSDIGARIMKIPNRGVKKESQSARKRLGLMREEGIIALIEVCFIDNQTDMQNYRNNINILAKAYAEILVKYENMIR